MKRIALALAVLFLAYGVAQPEMGNWIYRESVDLFTDEDNSYAYVLAHDHPQYADEASVELWCHAELFNGLVIAVFLDNYMGSSDTAEVTYRVDGGTPVDLEWWLIDESIYVDAHRLSDQERVFNDWIDGDLLILRAVTRLTSGTYQFRISGMRAAADRLNCAR